MSILALNLSVSVWYAVKVLNLDDKPIFFKGLTLLLIVFSLYGFLHIFSSPRIIYYSSELQIPSYTYLKDIYLSLLPIYPFYYYTRFGYLTEGKLRRWVIIFFVSCTLSFFNYQQKAIEHALYLGSQSTEVTNNIGYLFLSLIPATFIYRKKPVVQYLGFAIVITFLIVGLKRGAMLIGAIALVYSLRCSLVTAPRSAKRTIILLSIFLLVGAALFIKYEMQNSEYLMQRIQDTREGDDSGRKDIYLYFIQYFLHKTSLAQLLFGSGADGTLSIYGSYAHNDWLELAVDLGFVGVVVYVIYWCCLYKTWKCAMNQNAKNAIALYGITFFMMTLFSMSYNGMTYLATSILGYYLAVCRCIES